METLVACPRLPTPLKAAMEADVGGPSLPSSSSSQGLPLKHKPKLCDPKLDDDDAEGTSASQSASSAAESLQKRFMRTDLGEQSDKVKRTVVEGDEGRASPASAMGLRLASG